MSEWCVVGGDAQQQRVTTLVGVDDGQVVCGIGADDVQARVSAFAVALQGHPVMWEASCSQIPEHHFAHFECECIEIIDVIFISGKF